MKKYLIITIIIWSLFLASCSNEIEKQETKYFKTNTIQTWSIIDNKNYVWYVDSFQSISLAPKVWWKITQLYKKVWDNVKVWELVAILDSQEAKTWYASTNDIISNLQNLKISTSAMFDSQILVMEEKIKQAQTSIQIAQIWSLGINTWVSDTKKTIESQLNSIDSQISTSQTSLQTAKLNLENSKNILDQKIKDIYSNSKSSISNADIFIDNTIDFLDSIFWVTNQNKNKNDDFEIYLWAKNTTYKNEVESILQQLISKSKDLKNMSIESDEDIIKKLKAYNNLFENDIRNLLNKSYKTFENSVESTSFPQSIINEFKSQNASLQSQNELIILSVSWNHFIWLKWSLDSIINFEKEQKSTIDMLEKQVELANSQINTLNSQKQQILSSWNAQINDISTKDEVSKKQVELSKDGLNEAKAWLESLKKQKSSSLIEIDAQISQVKSSKNDAWVMIENWKITSLINWIITKKLVDIWSVVWAWNPIFMVSNDKDLKVNVEVPDSILNYIKVWDKVDIIIESSKKTINWTINSIFPSKDLITKKTTIEIKLLDTESQIWSVALVNFLFKVWDSNDIIIQNNAIVSKYNIPQVFVVKDGIANLRHIEIISQNDLFSKITWVEVWEEIIVEWQENIFDQEKLD